MQVLLVQNDQTVEVLGLQDQVSGSYQNAATVTARIKTMAGVDVTGVTWPITLAYVAASSGNYRGTFEAAASLSPGLRYIVEISAAQSGLEGFWHQDVTAQYRGF